MAAGSATLRAIPRPRAADGKTPTTAVAAGTAIARAIPRHRAAVGKTPTMAAAAGTAIPGGTPKPPGAGGTKATAPRSAATKTTAAPASGPAMKWTTGAAPAAAMKAVAAAATRTKTSATAPLAVTAAGRATPRVIPKRPVADGSAAAEQTLSERKKRAAQKGRPYRCGPSPMSDRHAIDLALGDRRQLLVRRFLFGQRVPQNLRDVIAPDLLRPRDQGPVAADLIVLDRLPRRDERGVENRFVGDLADDVVRLLYDPVDRRAVDGLGLRSVQLERLL